MLSPAFDIFVLLKELSKYFTSHGKCSKIWDRRNDFYLYTFKTHPWAALWVGCGWSPHCVYIPPLSVQVPAPTPNSTWEGSVLSIPQLRAAQWPREPPAEIALLCASRLPQLSGHVKSHSSTLHEKLKTCSDLMEGSGWGHVGELSHCWSGSW